MLNQYLRDARHARRWTQRDLARAAGLAQSYISKLESEVPVRPSIEAAQGLARAFGVPLEEILAVIGAAPSAAPDELPALLADARGLLGEHLVEAIQRGVEDMPADIRRATIQDLRAEIARARAAQRDADAPAQYPAQDPGGQAVRDATQAGAAPDSQPYGYGAAPFDARTTGLHEPPALYLARG